MATNPLTFQLSGAKNCDGVTLMKVTRADRPHYQLTGIKVEVK